MKPFFSVGSEALCTSKDLTLRPLDAVIGACAEQGKAGTVLTFNGRDFSALGKDFEVVIPGMI